MACEEVLKVVFPMLEAMDLLSCMVVCKQWRDIARDDHFWNCLCAKKWPSIAKRSHPPAASYYKMYQNFYKRQPCKTLLSPRISFDDLEFYIDIWSGDRLICSEVVPGPVLDSGFEIPLLGSLDMHTFSLEAPEYKMTLPVEPRFTVTLNQIVSVSVLVGRKDSNKIASIINKSVFCTAHRSLAFDYLDFSPLYPFNSGIRAWISLLFEEDVNEGGIEVFGIVLDFCDAANSETEFLWLLDMLDCIRVFG